MRFLPRRRMNPMDKGCLKGCLLSLIAMTLGFLLLFPIEELFNYMGWQMLNRGDVHGGTLIVAWALLFLIIYCLLVVIDRLWHRKSK